MCSSAAFAADWSVYLIMQSQGALVEGVQRAVQDLQGACAGTSRNLRICVEILASDQSERLLIDHSGVRVIHRRVIHRKVIHRSDSTDIIEILQDGCRFAFEQPAERTMLIFSGHGSGILEPSWDGTMKRWVYEPDRGISPRGDSPRGNSPFTRFGMQATQSLYDQVAHAWGRKSLFLSPDETRVTERDLMHLMKFVSTDLLGGKKIDIVGFDACHMAMLEIAYDLRTVARYSIASQDYEEKDGWDYGALVKVLASEQGVATTAQQIVATYDAQQCIRGQSSYSLSALDLSCVERVAAALDLIVDGIEKVLRAEQGAPYLLQRMLEALCRARQASAGFNAIDKYVDLHAFFIALVAQINLLQADYEIDYLKMALLEGINRFNELVIANGVGNECSWANGCSIYFPLAHIDSSYNNAFMQDHRWGDFLSQLLSPAATPQPEQNRRYE